MLPKAKQVKPCPLWTWYYCELAFVVLGFGLGNVLFIKLCLKWAETAKEQKKGLHWATKTGSMGKEEILYDWIRSGSFCIQFSFLYITPVDTNCYSKAFFNGKNPITLTKRQKIQMNPDERDQLRWGKSKRDEKITHLWYERMRIT